MSVRYSLRVFPNWLPSFSPSWQEATDLGPIAVDDLPSISITTERADQPMVPTISDLSLTCDNNGAFWDAIFNRDKIVGPIPPTPGTQLRAPLLHFGKILLCRKADLASQWQVVFFGYIDPTSVRFNRTEKQVTFTAFAPGKLLEKGNAERVHRFSGLEQVHPHIVDARPFLILGYDLVHPEVPPGGTDVDEQWWSLRLPGAASGQGPGVLLSDGNPTVWLQSGDQFKPVVHVATSAWVEGMKTVELDTNGPFTILVVTPRTNSDGSVDLLFKTQEAPTTVIPHGNGTMQHENPWYRQIDWGLLVCLLCGGTTGAPPVTYEGEVNAAMAAAGFTDTISADVSNLPLVSFSEGDHADLIYMADVPTPITGVAYSIYLALRGLGYTEDSSNPLLHLKTDILAQDYLDSGFVMPLWNASSIVVPAGLLADYIEGAEFGRVTRILSHHVIVPNLAVDFVDGTVQGPFAAQDVHLFDQTSDDFRSSHWMRTPSGYTDGHIGSKRLYRALAVGRLSDDGLHYERGLQISEWSMNSSGVGNTPIFAPPGMIAESGFQKAKIATPDVWPHPGDHVYPTNNLAPGIFGPYAQGGQGCDGIPNHVWILEAAQQGVSGGDYPPGYFSGVPQSQWTTLTKPTYISGGSSYCVGSRWVDDNGFHFTVPLPPGWLDAPPPPACYSPGGPPPPPSGSGWQWILQSNANNVHRGGAHAYPASGKQSRPSIKVYKLATNSFLYIVTNPFSPGGNPGEAFVKHNGTDDLAASAIPPFDASAAFVGIVKGASSGCFDDFSTYDGVHKTAFYFADRFDGTGVDLWYWNGAAMVAGSIVDATGQGLDLRGGDFINAIFDNVRHHFYLMQENKLIVMAYSFAAGVFTVTKWQAVVIDTPNYSPSAEVLSTSFEDTGAIAWLTAPVIQNNGPPEPDYTDAADALIVGTTAEIFIVSDTFKNAVDEANFDGLSVAAAMGGLIQYRGFSMKTASDQSLVASPSGYDPQALITFKQRLGLAPNPIDVRDLTEACEDGLWLQLYESVTVENSKGGIPPVPNDSIFSLAGALTFTIFKPRYPGSVLLKIDSPYIKTYSYAKVMANAAAAEFVIPRPDATIVTEDPYVRGGDIPTPDPFDVILYLVKAADSFSLEVSQTGRVMSIDFNLGDELLTIKVA
jgi:hypothetical protein